MQCPTCKKSMKFIGSCGIVDYEGRWDTEADRYRCGPCDIMVFSASANRIDEQEEDAADDEAAQV